MNKYITDAEMQAFMDLCPSISNEEPCPERCLLAHSILEKVIEESRIIPPEWTTAQAKYRNHCPYVPCIHTPENPPKYLQKDTQNSE